MFHVDLSILRRLTVNGPHTLYFVVNNVQFNTLVFAPVIILSFFVKLLFSVHDMIAPPNVYNVSEDTVSYNSCMFLCKT